MQPVINCDMGEGTGNDALIMPYISAANIACGYHAGDTGTMRATVELCIQHQVAIGAHVSFFDRDNFGRKEMKLSIRELYELVTAQLVLLNELTLAAGTSMVHVKPHGALYNLSASDPLIANAIVRAVRDFDDELILYGLSGSHSITEAQKLGLRTAHEVFADRTYQDDGSLTPRSKPGAMTDDVEKAVQQVRQMVNEGTVTTLSGKRIPILAETICIHGDGIYAVEFARAIHQALKKA